MISKNELNKFQVTKLNLAANMLFRTADLYDGKSKNLLPLWGGGIVSHGVPKIKKCVIGITEAAESAPLNQRTNDHLFRVTETVSYIIKKIKSENLSVAEIEDILLQRSSLMTTTREENNTILKKALNNCVNKDCWKELYEIAGIKYRLFK